MSPPMVPKDSEQWMGGSMDMLRAPGYESSCSRLPMKMAPALPSVKASVLSPGRAAMSCISSQQPVLRVRMPWAPARQDEHGPAGWAGPGSCWPTVTRATSPSHTAPCSGQSDRTLTDGLVLEGAQDTVPSSLWCLPLAASEEQRPTWPQLLLSTAGASQLDVDRQIPPQSGWCFTFLLYMPEEVQKNPHHCSKQATTTSPFKASGSSWVNWGTEWGFPASQGLPLSCWTARPWANLCSSASASLLFCWAGYLEGFCRWPPSN